MFMQSQLFTGGTTDWRTEAEFSGFPRRPMRHCPPAKKSQRKSAMPRSLNRAMLNTSDTIRSTQTDTGRILLDVNQGQMFSVNVVGSKILELLEQGWAEALIADEISQAYAINIDVVRADVHEFIDALHKHRIL
jgi:hypothetical protein